MPMRIQVLIIDDQHMYRSAAATALAGARDVTVAGVAGDAHAGLASAVSLRPAAVVVDVRMPGVGGVAAARMLADHPRLSGTRIVMLCGSGDAGLLFPVVRTVAAEFLDKADIPRRLLHVIRSAVRGDALLSPGTVRALVSSAAPRRVDREAAALLSRLTDRERFVVTQIALGRSNNEIASALKVGPSLILGQVRHIKLKIGARERMQLAVLAHLSGLVPAAPDKVRRECDARGLSGAVVRDELHTDPIRSPGSSNSS
jgi:DNA-binding NarL/FixJ family response regulator